jgi:hypothetical protein
MSPTSVVSLLVISSCMSCAVRPSSQKHEGTVILESGLRARWRYEFDRNSLQDARLSGMILVALTHSGDLLSFDAVTLTLRREREFSHDVVCLGSGPHDTVLAGADDGSVFKIHPETLEPTLIARVRQEIEWVGFDPITGGVLVMTGPTHEEVRSEFENRNDPLKCRLHDLATGKVHELRQFVHGPRGKSTVYVDSRRRVWVGYDAGEWGGGTIFVDLATGATGEVKDDSSADNVFGFFEPAPGEVWAYGGLIHFSANWFIARVDRGKAEMVLQTPRERDSEDKLIEPPPGTPRLPITGILPGGTDGSLLVLSYHELFRLHRPGNRWEKVCEFRPRYIQGRPDAMGSYPAIVRALQVGGNPPELICATRLDGFLRLSRGLVSRHSVPASGRETEPRPPLRVTNGLLFDNDKLSSFLTNRWPDRKVDPTPPPGDDDKEWREHFVMEEKDGSLLVLSADNSTPGRRQVARWKAGRVETLLACKESMSVIYCFTTPDGSLWCADHDRLLKFEGRDWIRCNQDRTTMYFGDVVSSGGPPWIYHSNTDEHQLYRLNPGRQPTEARLEKVAVGEKDRVLDILELEPGRFLLATDGGLKMWKSGDLTFSPPMIVPPSRKVWSLARDGSGRIWLGGEGLWLVTDKLIALDEVPHVSSMRVWSLEANPRDSLGVIVSPHGNPTLFVSVDTSER